MSDPRIIASQPAPQGLYVPAVRHGDMIFTAGMTPRQDGVLQFEGPLGAETPPHEYREAIVLACKNALTAARSQLRAAENIRSILCLTVYIAAEPGFAAHSKLADFASTYLRDELGEGGIGSRAAVGVASLPGNAAVEIQLIAAL